MNTAYKIQKKMGGGGGGFKDIPVFILIYLVFFF